jgi:hypothetical protein
VRGQVADVSLRQLDGAEDGTDHEADTRPAEGEEEGLPSLAAPDYGVFAAGG